MVNKQERKRIQDRGSALLTVIFIIIIFMIINGLFLFILSYRAKIENSEENTMKAYYLAQAAVNYGGALFKTSTILPSGEETVNNPFGLLYGGKFSVEYTATADTENPGFFIVNVRGAGYYPSGANQVKRIINTSYLWNPNVNSGEATVMQQYVESVGSGNSSLVFANSISSPTGKDMPKLLHAIVDQPYPIAVFIWNNGSGVRGSNAYAMQATFSLIDLTNDMPIKLKTALATEDGEPLRETAPNSHIYKIPDFTGDNPPFFYITIDQPYKNVKFQINANISLGNPNKPDPAQTETVTAFSVSLPLYLVWQTEEGN